MTHTDAVTRLSDPGETVAASGPLSAVSSGGRSYVSSPTSRPVPARSDDATFPPGTLLADRYRIVRPLGSGGMGIVYQADDLRLGQQVALKFLPPSLAGDPRRLAQFHNEVSLARQVSHPNVCRVYDIGDLDGHLFLTMEYIEGEDLAATLRRRGPFSEQEGVELARQICAGLAAVQARGILHRDLKPANIMRNKDGHPQLMDFGIAAAGAVDDAERISEGTPAYMAPEQLARAEVTAQSDVYALGLVMHEIFTGQRAGVGGVASSGWPRCHGAPQSSARHPAVHGSRSVAASRNAAGRCGEPSNRASRHRSDLASNRAGRPATGGRAAPHRRRETAGGSGGARGRSSEPF